jgi:EF-P beta-lysylation protein EpmB
MLPILSAQPKVVLSTAPSPKRRLASVTRWQQLMREAIRDPVELCRRLALPAEYEAAAIAAAKLFPVFAPAGYVAKMTPRDPRDPLLRQILPLADELAAAAGFSDDPLAEAQAMVGPGLLQKYEGRVLLIATGVCAIHCRYCFRRHFPYDDVSGSPQAWQAALDRIATDPSIDEVLLSGGDPLTLSDNKLAALARQLADIEHVRRLRIHSRLPIVIPERVTDELTGWLSGSRLAPIVVVHANHPRELDADVLDALARLVDAGIVVLNQAVLLRGVNDNLDVLASLCQTLINHRVLPYYLHQLDRVTGAAHFEVPRAQGRQLIAQLRRQLPGYAVPRYVYERAGAAHKIAVAW